MVEEEEENNQGTKNTVYVSKEQAEKIREVIAQKEETTKKLSDLEAENKQLKEEAEKAKEFKEYFDKHSGTGNLPSSLNGNEGGSAVPSIKQEFSDYESMIEWCRLNDRVAYESLKKKSANAIANNKNYWEWTDHFDENGNSLIGRTLHKQNVQKRNQK